MNKYCILKTYTLKETIEKIDESEDRVAIVINENEKVIGVVSQGDIIRALSSGKSLYSRVDGIVQTSFLYLKDRDMEKAYEYFKKKKITLIPVIDDDFMLQEVLTLSDIYDYLEQRNDSLKE